jgi:hypothetical protein
MATYEQAVDEVYSVAWKAGVDHSRWMDTLGKKEEDPASSDLTLERIEQYAETSFQVSVGARRALGQVLLLGGYVGTRESTQGRHPDPKQVWIRLVQWGIAKGLEASDELDKLGVDSDYHRITAANLGKNYEEYQDQIPSVRSLVEQ